MCGIVAVLRQPAARRPATAAEVLAELDAAADALAAGRLGEGAARIEEVDRVLRGVPGVRTLLGEAGLADEVSRRMEQATAVVADAEAKLDAADAPVGRALEERNAALVRLKDAAWAVQRDRLRTAAAVADLAGPDPGSAAVEAFT